MSDKSLVTRTTSSIVNSKSLSGAAGKGMLVAGAGGFALYLLAGLIPFVSFPVLCAIMLVAGFFMAE